MKKIILGLTLLVNLAHASEGWDAIPGQALGKVKIGMASTELKKLGFEFDKLRTSDSASTTYLKNQDLLVRLKNDKVIQMWLDEAKLNQLTIRGKKLPEKRDLNSLKKTVKDCEEHPSSGGPLLYCEGRGIEFSFSGDGQLGFSDILPSEVELIVGKTSSAKARYSMSAPSQLHNSCATLVAQKISDLKRVVSLLTGSLNPKANEKDLFEQGAKIRSSSQSSDKHNEPDFYGRLNLPTELQHLSSAGIPTVRSRNGKIVEVRFQCGSSSDRRLIIYLDDVKADLSKLQKIKKNWYFSSL